MTGRVKFWAVALMLGPVSASFGQGGGFGVGFQNFGIAGADAPKKSQICSVTIVSADGKTTTGTLRLTSAVIGCSFGIYEIKPEKVQEIRFNMQPRMDQIIMGQTGVQRAGVIATTSGEEIEGTVLIPSWWRVETDLGLLAPNSEGLKSISFVKKPENSPPATDAGAPQPGPSPPPVPGQVGPTSGEPPLSPRS